MVHSRRLATLILCFGLLSAIWPLPAGANDAPPAKALDSSFTEHEPNNTFANANLIRVPGVDVFGALNEGTDRHDVYKMYMNAGESLWAHVTGPTSPYTWYRIYIFGPDAEDFSSPLAVAADCYPNGTSCEASKTGYYYIDITTAGGSGPYGAFMSIWKERTSMTIVTSPTVSFGTTASIECQVKTSRGTEPYGDVDMFYSQDGVNWTSYGRMSISSTRFSFDTPPVLSKTYWRVDLEDNSSFGASSAKTQVTTKARLRIRSVRRIGNTLKSYVSGVLTPAHPAGTPVRIYAWRLVNNSWRSYGYQTAASTDAGSSSTYWMSFKFPTKGTWRLQAYHSDAGHLTTKTPYVYVSVD